MIIYVWDLTTSAKDSYIGYDSIDELIEQNDMEKLQTLYDEIEERIHVIARADVEEHRGYVTHIFDLTI